MKIEREPVDRFMVVGSVAAAAIVMSSGLTLLVFHPRSAAAEARSIETKAAVVSTVTPTTNGITSPLDVVSNALSAGH